VYCLDFIDWFFEYRAQYVFIVRHAFDVAQSLDRHTSSGVTSFITESTRPYLRRLDFRLHAFCEYWRDINMTIRVFAERHRDRIHLLRYEDLVREPRSTLETMFRFLGEEWYPEIIEMAFRQYHEKGIGDARILSTQRIETNRMDRWRAWDTAVCESLAPVVNEELERHGYSRWESDGGA
jgi:hypothetical protein